MIHVLVDGYFLGKPYGFGRYIQSLCSALSKLPPGAATFSIAMPDRPDLAPVDGCENLNWIRIRDRNLVLWEQVVIPRLAKRLACDLIHFPYNTASLFTQGIPRVCTIHDVVFLDTQFKQERANSGIGSLMKAKIAERYSKIAFRLASRHCYVLTPSEATRRALAAFGVQAQTVYNSVDGFAPILGLRRERDGQARYILHRGGYNRHRNTPRVIEAARRARQTIPDLRLIVIGTPAGAARFGVSDDFIEFKPWITDAQVAELYANSACLVATSLVEGFCLPILEAFTLQTPVITSNVDPMREIAGDAAVLVDPSDVDAIAAAIVSVVNDPQRTRVLVERGDHRRKDFSGPLIAQKLLQAYQTALS